MSHIPSMSHTLTHWALFFGGIATGALITVILIHVILKEQYEKPKAKK